MIDFGYFNRDCMEGMKEIPDKFFELAIVDPPYGIDIGSEVGGGWTGIPFGGKRNPAFKSAAQRRSEANLRGGGLVL